MNMESDVQLTKTVKLVCLCLLLSLITAALCLPLIAADGGEGNQESAKPRTIAELIESIGADDFAGWRAVRRLTEIGQKAVPALVAATSHEQPRVRYWSIAALSGIGDSRAVPAVKRLLDDKDPVVRAVAVWHGGRWFEQEGMREALLKKLDDPSKFVRGWALRLMMEKRCKQALPKILSMLKDKDEGVRYDALHAVAVLAGAEALPHLRMALAKDESALVRECALRACVVIEPRTAAAAEILIAGLRDESKEVRNLAAELLRKGYDRYFGFDPEASVEEREKTRWKWSVWYRAHRGRLAWDEKRRIFVALPDDKGQQNVAGKEATAEGAPQSEGDR